MRDHDEVFRRVMKAKEQYEQQKKEKSMFRFVKRAPRGGAQGETEGRKESSKLFVWAMRAVAALVCIAMIGGIIAAVVLGSKNRDTKDGRVGESGETPTNQVQNPTEGVTQTPQAESGTLTLWCNAVEGSYNKVAYERAIEEMRVRYPNIDLRVETHDDMVLLAGIKAAIQEGTLPDIFCVAPGYCFDEWISLGQVYCLDDVYADYAGVLPEAMCANTALNGKLYGVPYEFTMAALFVNMDVLRSVGIQEVPATYDELIACCDTLCRNGIVPFGLASGEYSEWCISEFVEQIIIKNAGASAMKAIYRENASWLNPDITEAIDIFEEFVRKGYFSPEDNMITRDDGAVKEDFMKGKYAFYLGGSWNCPALSDCDKEIVAMEFPVINSAKAGNGQFLCGTSAALAVSNSSNQKELAAQYAMELGQLISKYIYLDGAGLPVWKVNYNVTGVDRLSADLVEMAHQGRDFVPYGDNMMASRTLEVYVGLIRKVFDGEITGSVFTASMETTRAQ